MAAKPLTDEHWTGLPLLACDMDPGLYRIDVGTAMLVARDSLGTQVEVLARDGTREVFRQHAWRFDLFPAGVAMNATSDRRATKSLVVALPDAWLAAGDVLRGRYQFGHVALKRLVWRLARHHHAGAPLGTLYNEALSRSIVEVLLRLQFSGEAREPGREGLHPEARQLVERLVEHALQEPPSAAELSARIGIGQVRFVREFKVSFGATPHQYVQQRRIARARELLATTDAPVSSIALDTGFASQAHFSTVFRARTGITPSAFRRAAR